MARTDERGGPQTRARISEVATRLFLERGFDAVSVAEVAREAGVSSVTVFNHFPRKEDLLLDRQVDAADLLRQAIRDRPAGVDVLQALEALTQRLAEERVPLSGLDTRSGPFFRTVAASPALVARARAIAADLEQVLADELEHEHAGGVAGPSALLAPFFIAGYTHVLVTSARRLLAHEPAGSVADEHHSRLDDLFAALRRGVLPVSR